MADVRIVRWRFAGQRFEIPVRSLALYNTWLSKEKQRNEPQNRIKKPRQKNKRIKNDDDDDNNDGAHGARSSSSDDGDGNNNNEEEEDDDAFLKDEGAQAAWMRLLFAGTKVFHNANREKPLVANDNDLKKAFCARSGGGGGGTPKRFNIDSIIRTILLRGEVVETQAERDILRKNEEEVTTATVAIAMSMLASKFTGVTFEEDDDEIAPVLKQLMPTVKAFVHTGLALRQQDSSGVDKELFCKNLSWSIGAWLARKILLNCTEDGGAVMFATPVLSDAKIVVCAAAADGAVQKELAFLKAVVAARWAGLAKLVSAVIAPHEGTVSVEKKPDCGEPSGDSKAAAASSTIVVDLVFAVAGSFLPQQAEWQSAFLTDIQRSFPADVISFCRVVVPARHKDAIVVAASQKREEAQKRESDEKVHFDDDDETNAAEHSTGEEKQDDEQAQERVPAATFFALSTNESFNRLFFSDGVVDDPPLPMFLPQQQQQQTSSTASSSSVNAAAAAAAPAPAKSTERRKADKPQPPRTAAVLAKGGDVESGSDDDGGKRGNKKRGANNSSKPASTDKYSTMTSKDLQTLCKRYNLSASGSKDVLADRLRALE